MNAPPDDAPAAGAPDEPPPRSLARRLLDLSLPVIGLNVLNVLALAVDTFMCARLPDANVALTALGFATQIIFVLMIAMIGLTVGTVALVARAYGAGEHGRVNHLLVQSSQLTVVLAVVVAALGVALSPPLLRLLGASGPVLDASMAYLGPILVSLPFYFLGLLYAAVLRGVGNTRLPFIVALGVNVLNALLNYGLILGNLGLPALGVQGAALGTAISYAVSVVAIVALLRRGAVPGVELPLRPRPLDRPLAAALARVGAPAAADSVILNVSFLAVIAMLGRIDELAVAAHGIGLRVQSLAFVPGLSVSMATAALVGQALGAGRVADAREVTRSALRLCLGVMSSLGLLFVAFADPIVAFFAAEAGPAVHDLSVLWVRILGISMPLFGVHIALVGLLQGAGATRASLRINLVGTVAVQIPLGLLLAFGLELGALGVWLSFPLGFIVKTALTWAIYRGDDWATTGVHASG